MRRSTLLAIAVIATAGFAAPSGRAADVGRIPATYKVDPIGGFNYKIPIDLPPGPHGVTPQIALVYDSSSGANVSLAGTSDPDSVPAGAGWVLTGLSAIRRTSDNVAEDGVSSQFYYQASDRYVLDGNRLRLTSSTNPADYGADESTYQTEIADFSQVTAHGTTGYGPDYWTVQTKSGLTYEYGNTTDSKILAPGGASGQVREWLVDKVSDAYGNSYTVSYETGAAGSAGIAVPKTISWTPSGQGSSTYNYTATFNYVSRNPTEAITSYIGGSTENNNLLASITISFQNAPIRYYQLNYSSSPVTGRSLLQSIEQCTDSSLSKCLTPTGFAYNGGVPGISSAGETAVSGARAIIGAYDLAGNGLSDILYLQGSTLYAAFSNGNGFNPGVSTGATPQNYVIGDILGNGRDDVLVAQNGSWTFYSWNDGAFASTPLNVPFSLSCEYELADVNGDGLPDLLRLQVANGTVQIAVALNTSTGGSPSFGPMAGWTVNLPLPQYVGGTTVAAWFVTPQNYFQSFERLHFQGIKSNEVMLAWQMAQSGQQYGTTVIDELVPSGDTFNGLQITYIGTQVSGPSPQMFYGDFNHDGCTDFTFAVAPGDSANLYYSGCSGGAQPIAGNFGTVVGVADWNGDGQPDLLLNSGGTLDIETATGTGFSSMQPTNIPLASGGTVLPLRVTGSGLQDIGVISGGTLTYYLHNSVSNVADDPPDVLTALTDGNGNAVKISYASITAAGSSVYTAGTEAGTQDSAFDDSLFVVQALTLPDGLGGTYTQSYGYWDARANDERGFEGFARIKVTDSRSAEYRETSYDLPFPETGMVSEDDLFQSNGNKVSTTAYTNTDDELASTPYEDRHFPYSQVVTTDKFQVGGVDDGERITEAVTRYDYNSSPPDAYGNFTDVDTKVTDEESSPSFPGTWETETKARYVDDASTWCLTLPDSISVAQTAAGEPTITHTTTYTRDGMNCRPSTVLKDAGNSAYDVMRTYQYDGFGNVKQVQVSGSGFPMRTWTYGWGATGQFEETVQDPVAYASSYEEKIGYDYAKGMKKSDVIESTGGTQNTPPRQWNYDWLGRLTQETFPDGTTLNLSYAACSSNCYGGMETVTKTVNASQSSGGAEITGQSSYLDSFGRLVATTRLLMDGSSALVEERYDVFGNVVGQSAPCKGCASPEYWTNTHYDLANRPTSIVSPAPWVSGGEASTEITYTGLTTTITNADSETVTRYSDANGVLRRLVDGAGYEVDFTPDSDGNVQTISDAQGTITSRTYDYGGEGDYVAGLSDRALGSWEYTPDAMGDVTQYTDNKGHLFELWYDGLGRPIEREDWVGDPASTAGDPGISCAGNGVPNSCETDTSWVWGVTPASHDVGQLDLATTSTYDGTYVELSGYDGDGRLRYRNITIPGDSTYQYGYAYDPGTGLLSQLQYPAAGSNAGVTLDYGYSNGVLSSVTDASRGTIYWQDANPVSVNALGEVTQDTLGNGIITQTIYTDVTGWPTKIISGPSAGSAAVRNQSFSYDALGNVTQRQDGDEGQGLTENFYYDPDNRLQYSTLSNGSSTTTNLHLSYNPNGSINQKTEAGGTDAPVGYSVNWTSYNYPQSISATWPSSSQTEGAAFDYGPDRQRWRMTYTEGSASETTEYIGGLMEKVTSTAGTSYRYYISGASQLAAIVTADGSGSVTTHYVLEDHEGSISSLLNSTGTVAANESFTAYGNRREASTWSGPPTSTEEAAMDAITRQGFIGQTILGQMGLNHMNGRVEDAVSGTFLSPDPYVSDPENAQDYYRYAYVYNNPLTNVDPSGFSCAYFLPGDTVTAQVLGLSISNHDSPGDYLCSTLPPGGAGPFLDYPGGSGPAGTPEPRQTQVPCAAGTVGANCQIVQNQKNQQQQSNPHQCTFAQQVLGTLQNKIANEINNLSINYGVDFLYGTGNRILYGTGSLSVNSRGQVVLSYGTSNSMQGFVYGAMGGGGYGFGRSAGPATSGNGTSTAAVGGVAVVDDGVMGSGSMDPGSTSLPAPGGMVRGDFAGGLGFGGAAGNVQTTTVATPPIIPRIPTSSCHL